MSMSKRRVDTEDIDEQQVRGLVSREQNVPYEIDMFSRSVILASQQERHIGFPAGESYYSTSRRVMLFPSRSVILFYLQERHVNS